MPRPRSATGLEAPQSRRMVRSLSIMKQVLKRPPEPKASPDPRIVRRIASRLRARPRGGLTVPPPHVGKVVGNGELGGFHEIDRYHAGDIRDRVMVARDEKPIGELAIEEFQKLHDARLV